MPKRKPEKPQLSRPEPGATPRERILAAAAEVFAEHGFAGAGVDEVAARAGVNKAMLYYHVGDKAALYAAVIAENLARVTAAVEAAVGSTDDPAERLRRIQRAFIHVFETSPCYPQLMLREIAAGGANLPPAVLESMGRLLATTRRVLEEGRRRGRFRRVNPVLTHLLVVGSLVFVWNAQRFLRRVDELGLLPEETPSSIDDIADTLSDIILNGIAATRSPRRSS